MCWPFSFGSSLPPYPVSCPEKLTPKDCFSLTSLFQTRFSQWEAVAAEGKTGMLRGKSVGGRHESPSPLADLQLGPGDRRPLATSPSLAVSVPAMSTVFRDRGQCGVATAWTDHLPRPLYKPGSLWWQYTDLLVLQHPRQVSSLARDTFHLPTWSGRPFFCLSLNCVRGRFVNQQSLPPRHGLTPFSKGGNAGSLHRISENCNTPRKR